MDLKDVPSRTEGTESTRHLITNEHPMLPHLIVLSAAARDWQDFLGHSQAQLMKLVSLVLCRYMPFSGYMLSVSGLIIAFQGDKACFLKIESSHKQGNNDVAFSDCQSLQLLRQKLLKIASILDSCLNVARRLKSDSDKLETLNLVSSSKALSSEISVYIEQFREHRRDLDRILEISQGTGSLVSLLSLSSYATFPLQSQFQLSEAR